MSSTFAGYRNAMALALALVVVANGLPLDFASAQSLPARLGVPSAAKVFGQQCGACHSRASGELGVGPSLAGIGGRKAGTSPGFQYSAALRNSRVTWDRGNLDKWLTNSGAMVPGTTMIFAQKDPVKRRMIIDFLFQ